MTAPNLKRVTISSLAGLESWLLSPPQTDQPVMLVTHSALGNPGHVSRDKIDETLSAHGWTSTRRYTLTRHSLGHVVQRKTE